MRTDRNIARLRANAEEFGIKPELAWLMEAQPLWDEIKHACVTLNRGADADMIASLDVPTERLRSELLTLTSMLEKRKC